MTVSDMLSNMTQNELVYWMAYHKMKNEEFEESRKDSASGKSDKVKGKSKEVINEEGYRVVSEEEQKIADQNMLSFFQMYSRGF